jgi:uncharacterized protein with HEPN domain
MAKREDHLLLLDMLDAADRMQRYVEGLTAGQFLEDEKTVDAVVRNLEVLGEAANRLSDGFRADHPHVPWRRMIGLRHRIVHEYFGIDLAIVWRILQDDLPSLRQELADLVERHGP